MTVEVSLAWAELRYACYVGVDRYIRARANGWLPRHEQPLDDWTAHMVGAWGELALAKHTDRLWPTDGGRPDKGRPDVGSYHVRTTTNASGRLILTREDPDEAPHVLVVIGRLPTVSLIGWCFGREGKREEYIRAVASRPPCYMVPREVLRPISSLVEARSHAGW